MLRVGASAGHWLEGYSAARDQTPWERGALTVNLEPTRYMDQPLPWRFSSMSQHRVRQRQYSAKRAIDWRRTLRALMSHLILGAQHSNRPRSGLDAGPASIGREPKAQPPRPSTRKMTPLNQDHSESGPAGFVSGPMAHRKKWDVFVKVLS